MPKKEDVVAPNIKANQLSMAEIIYPEEKELKELIDNALNLEENSLKVMPELSQITIQESFKDFAAKQSKPSLKSLLGMLEPILEGEKLINLKINSQQDELIEGIKVDLKNFVKQYFSDKDINIQIEIDNSVEFKKFAYTDKEKLQELMEENEMVKTLVERLKLKTDY